MISLIRVLCVLMHCVCTLTVLYSSTRNNSHICRLFASCQSIV